MKKQALFSSKDKSKKIKCRLLQFLFGALRVNDWAKGYIAYQVGRSFLQCFYFFFYFFVLSL